RVDVDAFPTLPARSRGTRVRVYRPSGATEPVPVRPSHLTTPEPPVAGALNERTIAPDAFSIDTPIDPASLIEKATPPVSCTPSPFGETVPRSAAGPTAASAGATLSMRTASVRRDATLPAASVAAYVIVCGPSVARSIGP